MIHSIYLLLYRLIVEYILLYVNPFFSRQRISPRLPFSKIQNTKFLVLCLFKISKLFNRILSVSILIFFFCILVMISFSILILYLLHYIFSRIFIWFIYGKHNSNSGMILILFCCLTKWITMSFNCCLSQITNKVTYISGI